jgi:hypothetical protein
MASFELAAGIALVLITVWDAFETIILPRTVRRRFRLSRLIIVLTWLPFLLSTKLAVGGSRRDGILSIYGPLLLVMIFGSWVICLILSFTLIFHGLPNTEPHHWGDALYFSGTTFFTLGLGDLTPSGNVAKVTTVIEAGTGFGLLALVIGYLPIFYQAFSRREVAISLLDARAGSPPTAFEFVRRNRGLIAAHLLESWETWIAELLEGHLSYPMLLFFRSQHERQSWLAALTMILDTSSLILVGVEGVAAQQARFTYAIARHCLVDLTQVLFLQPLPPSTDRLPHERFVELEKKFQTLDLRFSDGANAEAELAHLRAGYEPLANALAKRLIIDMPAWLPADDMEDNWQSSPWDVMPNFYDRSN